MKDFFGALSFGTRTIRTIAAFPEIGATSQKPSPILPHEDPTALLLPLLSRAERQSLTLVSGQRATTNN